LLVEVNYIDKDGHLLETKEQAGQDYYNVQDHINLDEYLTKYAPKHLQYGLFAAINIDTTSLHNCLYVSAIEKRNC
jgi:hypothetical protein